MINQCIMEKISNKIALIDYEALESWKSTEDLKETFKELKQQLNHETDLCTKDLEKHLEKKEKVDLIFQSLLFVPVEDEDSCMTPLKQV